MRRIIYYRAFLQLPGWEFPRLEWFASQVDPDRVDEELTEIAAEHMRNRLIGGWRLVIPFNIDFKIGAMTAVDYSI